MVIPKIIYPTLNIKYGYRLFHLFAKFYNMVGFKTLIGYW